VTQVRGFADQRLRNPKDPLDPSNRRISLIVRYLEKAEAPATGQAAPAEGDQKINGESAAPLEKKEQ
jgi:chemotaxis protein MotB